MVCFIILIILTAVFFGMWIYKKYISIVNPLAWVGGIVDAI